MKLERLESLRDRIGFDSIAEIDDALSEALEQSTSTLSSHIRTTFNLESVTEYFSCIVSQELGAGHQLKLKLKKGFVTNVSNIVYGSTIAELSDRAGGQSLEDFMILNEEEGTITILGINLENTIIKVEYEAGFNTADEEPDVYDPNQVPEWLKEAAQVQALIIFDTVHPQHRYEDKSSKKSVDNMKRQLESLLLPYIRYVPGSLISLS